MGVDLTVLPLSSWRGDDADWKRGFAHSMLELDRDRRLWDVIRDTVAVEAHPDFNFTSYLSREDDQESHYGRIRQDSYGTPLQWARAGDLASALTSHLRTIRDFEPIQNTAVRNYLAALYPLTPVALYWH